MSKIKGKNTKPEVAVRQYLHRKGYRFRLHRKDLPGNPDIVLPSRMIAIFVHGCFWHRHRGCKKTTTPSTNRAFWERKFKDNVNRDERNTQALQKLGWAVMVIWECEVNDQGLETIAAKVESIPQKMKMSSTKRT
ncbi:XorII very short patch repair endonuclease [Pseudodesulfovibrio profundus]|uniref:Very short patch repair endonuclease n=2 Tax=Pseudodesulfovibrio profundus TaxID=57320 RepID=A0A2C8F585_9BACT|nr:XorII very short patch repair endonuclease [Pseudodesulfovibrio profundus]